MQGRQNKLTDKSNVAQGAFLSETGTGCMGNSHRWYLKDD